MVVYVEGTAMVQFLDFLIPSRLNQSLFSILFLLEVNEPELRIHLQILARVFLLRRSMHCATHHLSVLGEGRKQLFLGHVSQ